jgi:hypothetical protein
MFCSNESKAVFHHKIIRCPFLSKETQFLYYCYKSILHVISRSTSSVKNEGITSIQFCCKSLSYQNPHHLAFFFFDNSSKVNSETNASFSVNLSIWIYYSCSKSITLPKIIAVILIILYKANQPYFQLVGW